MGAFLFGALMLGAGLAAFTAGGGLAVWWNEPRGSYPNQRPARADTAPLLLAVGLVIPWIVWMVTAVIVAAVGAVGMLFAVVVMVA